ncbi:hypothetical protein FG05_35015 [Fusarium graminearum]|nr:hypothetical protein FG05_35015 [Fusarium graminearum]
MDAPGGLISSPTPLTPPSTTHPSQTQSSPILFDLSQSLTGSVTLLLTVSSGSAPRPRLPFQHVSHCRCTRTRTHCIASSPVQPFQIENQP